MENPDLLSRIQAEAEAFILWIDRPEVVAGAYGGEKLVRREGETANDVDLVEEYDDIADDAF